MNKLRPPEKKNSLQFTITLGSARLEIHTKTNKWIPISHLNDLHFIGFNQ